MRADLTVNATGLSCPMPVLKTKKALDMLSAGKVLLVETNDPATKADIPQLVKRLGHELVEKTEQSGVFSFYILKKK